MNKLILKAKKEDFLFCNHYLNIQLDFLFKLYYKTEEPIVGQYIVEILEKVKKYRFWEIIRPILVDRNLDFWRVKFNYLPKEYKDEYRKILYLSSYYPRDDISYTFKFFLNKSIVNYINFHLDKIKNFFTNRFDKLFKNYINNNEKKYNLKRDKLLENIKDENIIFFVFPVLKRPKVSKIAIKNINKKIVNEYKDYVKEISM